jgi:carboxymethylenebutenolidase
MVGIVKAPVRVGEKMKTVKRILLILLGLVTGLVLLLAGSIAIDFAIGGERINEVTNTTIPGQGGGPDVRAYVAVPPGEGPFPVVIMIHEFYGLNEKIVGKAAGLAKEGYLVISPDTFRGSTTTWIPRAIYQVIRSKPEQVNQDLDSVYAWIEAQPHAAANRTGIVGFCYGGRASLSYSLHNDQLAATVIFYGSPVTDPQVLSSLPGPVLGIFGGADNSIPVEDVIAFEAALNQAGIPNEITLYEGQPHAFVTDMESIYSGGVQGQAWAQMLEFFEENLKSDAVSQNPNPLQTHLAYFDWKYYLIVAFEHAFGTASHHQLKP